MNNILVNVNDEISQDSQLRNITKTDDDVENDAAQSHTPIKRIDWNCEIQMEAETLSLDTGCEICANMEELQ